MPKIDLDGWLRKRHLARESQKENYSPNYAGVVRGIQTPDRVERCETTRKRKDKCKCRECRADRVLDALNP